MFCPKCGQSLPEGAVFCPACGFNMAQGFDSPNPESAPAPDVVYPLDKAKKTLTDPLFLAIAILLSIAAVANVFYAGINILLVLIVVGVWMAYSGATGEDTGLIGKGISLTSVSVKIEYILVNVGIGLIVFCGIILFVVFANIGDLAALSYESIEQAASDMGIYFDAEPELAELLHKLFTVMANLSGVVIGAIFFVITLICAGIALLYNILFTRRFSKFLSNASRAVKEGKIVEISNRRCANWIMAYGIITAIEALSAFSSYSNLFALISTGCIAASCIMASIMMKKEI